MSSTALTRTPGSAGNRRTWTWSAWIKKSKIAHSSAGTLFGAKDGSYPEILYFASDDTLVWQHDISGSDYLLTISNRKFRDVSGWLHIVLTKDTTQSTEADRVKIYINGEQQTLTESQLGFPGQNYEGAINNNVTHTIGNWESNSYYFDGSMSHIHFTDGYAYAASTFGETDSTTGQWKINTNPSVTYGTNGFFILKDGNSVTDQSGNSNDFSVEQGTLTKTEDNPSNVFATLNPLVNLGTTSRTITNGNTKFNTSTSAWGNILSTLAFSSGKFYAEFEFTTLRASSGYGGMGITDASENYDANDNLVNNTAFSAGVRGDYRSGQSALVSAASVVSSNIGNFSNGDIIGLAADMDNKALYVHLNGTYYQVGGVTGVPTSGSSKTGALTIPATCVDCMFFAASYTVDAVITANFGNGYFGTTAVSSAGTNASGNGIFEYDVPTGYTALSTKGLNL